MHPNPTLANPTLRDSVGRVAAFLASEGGHRAAAELRRLHPEQPDQPAFFRIVSAWLEPAGLLPSDHDAGARFAAETAWATVLSAMARLTGLHSASVSLGAGLALAEVSEQRLLKLLRSSDDTLRALVRTTAHQIAAKAVCIDQAELAWLVCSDGYDAELREAPRRRIALDFYRRFEATFTPTAPSPGE